MDKIEYKEKKPSSMVSKTEWSLVIWEITLSSDRQSRPWNESGTRILLRIKNDVDMLNWTLDKQYQGPSFIVGNKSRTGNF